MIKRLILPFISALVFAVLIAGSALASEKPQVRLVTNVGEIVLELDGKRAPGTVHNFLSYVESGHYNGTIFHRVMRGFMIQGGGFISNFSKKPTGSQIRNEADNGLRNVAGSVAMARTGNPHSASAQFFINTVDNRGLDFRSPDRRGWGYAVFGRVIKGIEVVRKIEDSPTKRTGRFANMPRTPVIVNKAEIIRP